METSEKVMLSIMLALIITCLLTALITYLDYESFKQNCIDMGGNYTETAGFIISEQSCKLTTSSMTVITSVNQTIKSTSVYI